MILSRNCHMLLLMLLWMASLDLISGVYVKSVIKSSRCYDCVYNPLNVIQQTSDSAEGVVKVSHRTKRWFTNPQSVIIKGFRQCSLLKTTDETDVSDSSCSSGTCFIRQDPNGLVYRGCADEENLPYGVSTNSSCYNKDSKTSIWWFCNGHLCNGGAFGKDGICENTTISNAVGRKKNNDKEDEYKQKSREYWNKLSSTHNGEPAESTFNKIVKGAGYDNAKPIEYGGTGLTSEEAFRVFQQLHLADRSNKEAEEENEARMMQNAPISDKSISIESRPTENATTAASIAENNNVIYTRVALPNNKYYIYKISIPQVKQQQEEEKDNKVSDIKQESFQKDSSKIYHKMNYDVEKPIDSKDSQSEEKLYESLKLFNSELNPNVKSEGPSEFSPTTKSKQPKVIKFPATDYAGYIHSGLDDLRSFPKQLLSNYPKQPLAVQPKYYSHPQPIDKRPDEEVQQPETPEAKEQYPDVKEQFQEVKERFPDVKERFLDVKERLSKYDPYPINDAVEIDKLGYLKEAPLLKQFSRYNNFYANSNFQDVPEENLKDDYSTSLSNNYFFKTSSKVDKTNDALKKKQIPKRDYLPYKTTSLSSSFVFPDSSSNKYIDQSENDRKDGDNEDKYFKVKYTNVPTASSYIKEDHIDYSSSDKDSNSAEIFVPFSKSEVSIPVYRNEYSKVSLKDNSPAKKLTEQEIWFGKISEFYRNSQEQKTSGNGKLIDLDDEKQLIYKYNPCTEQCKENPSALYHHPLSPGLFIQCGPGSNSDRDCQCCTPNYILCPSGSYFHPVSKVCVGASVQRGNY